MPSCCAGSDVGVLGSSVAVSTSACGSFVDSPVGEEGSCEPTVSTPLCFSDSVHATNSINIIVFPF